ncbi:hypothetical protein [Amycolatopsis sp. PS_44_ISF1]|uniref:hypothetical protein n=1 Tax=Amycolatopsis sp. PS_44_ISF1 TaxID=2974917 RepID=UPI0028DFE766|nr:hypothetical protein [Amycolatopsis sp. PS_44_ISF1]MDT8910355.1 hypothetical protein [Amycolatopsis sp. PS_44_ISF1]
MSWQEELRRLDEELASGRLSADDYRIRRDQVLSSAVGQQDPAPQPQPNSSADSTQVIAPVSPPHGVPQQPPATPPQPAGDQSAERTQAVSWQQQPQQTPHTDVSRTEYVQPQPQPPQPQYSPSGGFSPAGPQSQSPSGGFPHSPQAPWNAPEGDQSPPWGGDSGTTGGSDSDWSVRQGPEFFSEKPKNSGNGKKIGAIVGAVVVLAALAFGAYLLWGRDNGNGGDQQAAPTQQAPSSAPKPPDPMAVGAMPGQAETHDDITSFGQVDSLKYLNPQELEAYQAAGAGKVKFVVYKLDNGDHLTLLITQASSAKAAKTAAEKLEQIQVTNGAKRDSTAPDGVYATTIDQKDGQSAQARGHYAHGKVIVRVESSGPGSLSQVKTDFTSALSAQLTALPANG